VDKIQVIADTTFYLVFLHDIDKPHYFTKIVEAHDFLLPPLVDKEIQTKLRFKRKTLNYNYIAKQIENKKILKLIWRPNLEAIIAPRFGKTNPKLGEYEVVAYSHHLVKKNPSLRAVIDDIEARQKIRAIPKLNHVYNILKWTTDIIKESYYDFNVLNKRECLQIFYDMKNVKSPEKPNAGALKIPYWMYDEMMNKIKSYKE
jgi:hypothetical protein